MQMESSKQPHANWARTVVQQCRRCADRLPVVTLLLSAIAILFQIWPDLGASMSFDRTAIAAGEYWRIVTGHLTHWNADHMAWDVFMFVVLGAMIERRDRACMLATLIASAASISVAVWCGHLGVDQYRGLSGVDSTLFTLCALMLYNDAHRAKQTVAVWLMVAMATAFVGKLVWELKTGSTLFVDSSAAGFTPLPLIHAVGGCAGVLVWCGARARITRYSCLNCSRPSATEFVSG
jgi:rhomboid family GlyGly-CTERM serine protease